MRSKKSFSFNEEVEAEKLYNDGFVNGDIDYSKMYLIAKYIRQTFEYGEIRLERELIRFCKKQNNNFNPIIEAAYIRKWVKSALNYDLRKIESITVSQKEIDMLKPITNNKNRKLMFIILIFSKALKKGSVKRDKTNLKLSDNYYIHYNNFSDIIRLAKLTNTSEIDLADILHDYNKYFTFYKPERELIRLEFIDKKPDKEIIINDLNKIVEYYNILFMEHKLISVCKICGKEIKKNSNIQKYCKDCAKIKSREQHKELMQKRRAKE
jgi:hypothetical protein